MPLDLTCETTEITDLAGYTEFMDRVDLADRDAVLATAPQLKALFNNRTFLLDVIAEQVVERMARGQAPGGTEYTPNVFVLARRRGYAVRAVIWPAATGPQTLAEKSFYSFDLPHDHNFDFMTVGYQGPGYETDLYEYDRDQVVGYAGEPVALIEKGRERLSEGRILFFRRGVDVHTQLPPAALSISLNLILDPEANPGPQHTFDLARPAILEDIHRDVDVAVVELFAPLLDDETAPKVERLCASHTNPRVRLRALQLLAGRGDGTIWRRALQDPSPLVRYHAGRALAGEAP